MKLIKLQHKFILVSDEVIKIGDKSLLIVEGFVPMILTHFEEVKKGYIGKKIISENPDLSDLKEEDCKAIGFVDVEKLVLEAFKQGITFSHKEFSDTAYNRFRTWFSQTKIAQSLNDKQFSLEDMKNAIKFGNKKLYKALTFEEKRRNEFYTNEFIKSLQKTEWDVEVEMEEFVTKSTVFLNNDVPYSTSKPKITNNSIKVIKIL